MWFRGALTFGRDGQGSCLLGVAGMAQVRCNTVWPVAR